MSYSLMPELYEKMYLAHKAGEYEKAKIYQRKINQVIEVLDRYGLAGYKLTLTMKWLGVDCGEPRLPLRRLSSEERERLKEELNEIDFKNILNREE